MRTKKALKQEVARLTAELAKSEQRHRWCDYAIKRREATIERLAPGLLAMMEANDQSNADYDPQRAKAARIAYYKSVNDYTTGVRS